MFVEEVFEVVPGLVARYQALRSHAVLDVNNGGHSQQAGCDGTQCGGGGDEEDDAVGVRVHAQTHRRRRVQIRTIIG